MPIVGLSAGHDQGGSRGSPGGRCFPVVYFKDERVIALDRVGATKDFVQGKALVEANARVRASVLADTSLSYKFLAFGP